MRSLQPPTCVTMPCTSSSSKQVRAPHRNTAGPEHLAPPCDGEEPAPSSGPVARHHHVQQLPTAPVAPADGSQLFSQPQLYLMAAGEDAENAPLPTASSPDGGTGALVLSKPRLGSESQPGSWGGGLSPSLGTGCIPKLPIPQPVGWGRSGIWSPQSDAPTLLAASRPGSGPSPCRRTP